MNLDKIDLSTWRDDAPPRELRARVLPPAPQPRRALPNPRLARLGVVAATFAGLGTVVFLATAPVSAEALLRQAQNVPATQAVHLTILGATGGSVPPSWNEGSVTEIWATPDVRRETLRYPHDPRKKLDASGHEVNTDVDHDTITVRVDGRESEEIAAATGFVLAAGERRAIRDSATGEALATRPQGVFKISRLRGALRAEPEAADALRNFASPFRLDWIYAYLGGKETVKVEEIEGTATTRVLLIAGAQPRRMRISIDRATGWMVGVREESGGEGRWKLRSTARFEYPVSLDPGLFDPSTLRP